jgi:hypothetical protein
MGKHEEGIRKVGKDLCRTLIETEKAAPNDSSFEVNHLPPTPVWGCEEIIVSDVGRPASWRR